MSWACQTHEKFYSIKLELLICLDRVVLKVDENSNAKITFTLASVNRVLTDSDNERSVGVGA